MRKEVRDKIIILSNKLDSHYINKLIDKAHFGIENKDITEATKIYDKIRRIYSRISPGYKSQVLERCNELRLELSKKNAK